MSMDPVPPPPPPPTPPSSADRLSDDAASAAVDGRKPHDERCAKATADRAEEATTSGRGNAARDDVFDADEADAVADADKCAGRHPPSGASSEDAMISARRGRLEGAAVAFGPVLSAFISDCLTIVYLERRSSVTIASSGTATAEASGRERPRRCSADGRRRC
jgi:hypothetical protein